MDSSNEMTVSSVFARPAQCICCRATVVRTAQKQPLCSACVSPGEARSYCAKCGHRGEYPYDDFKRVMSKQYPDIKFGSDIAVRLPACQHCNNDGRPPLDDGQVHFYGIDFD
jgi:hypothetical protein